MCSSVTETSLIFSQFAGPLGQSDSATHQIDVIITPLSLLGRSSPLSEFRLRVPIRIFKLQSDENLHFVEAVMTVDAAKARVQELGELWPGEYVIRNEETGERFSITIGEETKN